MLLGVSPLHSQQQEVAVEETDNIQKRIEVLERDITRLQFLISKIVIADKADREVLFHRQDKRIFKLMNDFDSLVLQVAEISDDSPQRKALEQQLTDFGSNTGNALILRIEDIKQRITGYNSQLSELSGATKIAAEAYIHSMESIRIKYYEAMASHIETREVLNLSSESSRDQLGPELYLYAETLAGRIEFAGKARRDVQNRLSEDPNNTDIDAAMKDLNDRHQTSLQRLEGVISVLDQLELDSSEYKTVMLQQASSISVNQFSSSALLTVLRDGWEAMTKALKNNAPDLTFRLLLFIVVLIIFRALSRIAKRVVRTATNRRSIRPSAVARVYLSALMHNRFPALIFSFSLGFAGLFLYIAGAPTVIYDFLGLGGEDFGWLFIPIVAGLVLGASISGRLAHRWPAQRTISAGLLMMILATVLNMLAVSMTTANILFVIGPLVFYVIGLALMMPAITVLALDCLPTHRGTAASMQGFLQSMSNAAVASFAVPMLSGSWSNFVFGQLVFLLLAAGLWYRLIREGLKTDNEDSQS